MGAGLTRRPAPRPSRRRSPRSGRSRPPSRACRAWILPAPPPRSSRGVCGKSRLLLRRCVLPACAKIPRAALGVLSAGGRGLAWRRVVLVFRLVRRSLALELRVHLVGRHVHLVEPALQQRRVIGLQRRIALRQARNLDLLAQDLVVQCLHVSARVSQTLRRSP